MRRVTKPTASILWLEWKHYYADNSLTQPHVVLVNHQVFDMNRLAVQRGVKVGMRKHQYKALADNCLVSEFAPNPARSNSWLDLCAPYSSVIEPNGEHAAALDLSAHPSPVDLVNRLLDGLLVLEYGDLYAALAPSKWLAQLASSSQQGLAVVSDPANYLAHRPISSLSVVEPEILDRLRFLGYKTIGEVATLTTEVLRSQFGDDYLTIQQASRGTLRDHVLPVYPEDELHEFMHFAEPIDDLLMLESALSKLSLSLSARLSGQQATGLTLSVQFEDHQEVCADRMLKRPIYGNTGLLSTLKVLLPLIKISKPVIRLGVKLNALEPLRTRQKALFAKDNPVDPNVSVRIIRNAYGDQSLMKATEIVLPRREQVLKEWRRATGWY